MYKYEYRAVYCLCLAAILEGCSFALYSAFLAGHDGLLREVNNVFIYLFVSVYEYIYI
jgi:hypothetical protein